MQIESFMEKADKKTIPSMLPVAKAKLLDGKKGLIVGIANENSIAWGCAKAFRALGAEVAVTYLNDKAKKYIEPLARVLESPIVMPLDVNVPGQMESVFDTDSGCVGPTRFCGSFDCLLAKGSPQRARGRCEPRWLPDDNGCVVLDVYSYGAPGRTPYERKAGPCSR